LFAPDAEIEETFVNVMLGRPPAVTVPALPDESAHVDEAASTASDVVPAPVTLMAVTIDAGRASLAPLIVTVTFDPDDPIAIAFALPVVETVHGPRNAVEVEPVAFVLASIGVDAVIVTTPGFALVTATAHVPSAAVTQDGLPRVALAGVAVKVTVAPAIVAPDDVTVATTLAFDPTSTRAGADAVTITFDAGVGIGLALGVGVGLGDSVGGTLGLGDALVESVGDGDALGVGDGVGVSLGVGDELGEADGVAEVDGEGAGVEDGEADAGVESIGLGDGEAVGSSDIDSDVGVQRLAILDPFPETGAATATTSDVSTDPAGAYVGAGVFEGAALGAGVGDGSALVVADGCGLSDGRAVVVGRADVDGAVDDGTALGAGFADGTTE
jgi:hypothetical protein